MNDLPNFRSRDFLLRHMREIMDFYHPACINESDGGYFNYFRNDGFITNRKTQHIVSTTRFIFNFSLAAGLLDRPEFLKAAEHGLKHLDEVHRDPEHGGYFWMVEGRSPSDADKHCLRPRLRAARLCDRDEGRHPRHEGADLGNLGSARAALLE